MMNEEISVESPFIKPMKVKWASYAGSKLGDDVYYLYEFVQMGINFIGEDKLVEMMKNDNGNNKTRINKIGNEWYKPNGFLKKLKNIGILLRKTKATYDLLKDKTFEKRKEEIKNWRTFVSNSSKVALFEPDLYAVAVFIVQNTSFKKQNISSEDIKLLETKGSRAFDIPGIKRTPTYLDNYERF